MENKLKVEYVDIDTIKPYKNNAKLHPKEQIEQIKKSIENFGMNDPIGIWNNEIVEGHGRILACKELGYKQIPVIKLDHLTDDERKSYIIAHNKLTMNSDFDIDILRTELENLKKIKQKNHLEEQAEVGALFQMKKRFDFQMFKNISFVETDKNTQFASLILSCHKVLYPN